MTNVKITQYKLGYGTVDAITVSPSDRNGAVYYWTQPGVRGSLAMQINASSRVSGGYRRYQFKFSIPTEGIQNLTHTDGKDGDAQTIALGTPSQKFTLVDLGFRLDTELNQQEMVAALNLVKTFFTGAPEGEGSSASFFESMVSDGQGIW